MKTLLLLRHAKSSWKHPELADHERPLNPRGKRDAPRMGELLVAEDLVPNLILSSSAVRARRTAEAVAESCGYEGEIVIRRDLYDADTQSYLDALHNLPESVACALVVGHNPDLEDLIEQLTDEHERMPTAALAWLRLPVERWEQLHNEVPAELVQVWWPRHLD